MSKVEVIHPDIRYIIQTIRYGSTDNLMGIYIYDLEDQKSFILDHLTNEEAIAFAGFFTWYAKEIKIQHG